MSGRLTVAVAQPPAGLGAAAERLDWLAAALDRAGAAPDLVVLPELFQSGYNVGDLVARRAEPPDGPFARGVAALARAHGTAILYGYAERAGAALYNAAQCIDAEGAVIGHHRKLLLPPGFEGDHFQPGTGCSLFRLGGLTVAILVCYDVEFPETLRHVALAGADLVAVPTALGAEWRVVAHAVVPARAFENGVFLCYANYAGEENGLAYLGGSCIVAPDGRDLARAGASEDLLTAAVDRAAIAPARRRLPFHVDRLKLPWV